MRLFVGFVRFQQAFKVNRTAAFAVRFQRFEVNAVAFDLCKDVFFVAGRVNRGRLEFLPFDGRFHKRAEQRVRVLYRTLIFGVELHAEEERVHAARQRNGFHQFHAVFLIDPHALQARRFEVVAVGLVEFVAVAVPFADFTLAVGLIQQRAFLHGAGVGAQPHRAAHLGQTLLTFHQVDDRMRRQRVHFGRMRVLPTQDMAREFHHAALHAETDAQKRDFLLTRVADGFDFAVDAAHAKARRHQNTLTAFEQRAHGGFRHLFRMHRANLHLARMRHARMDKRFVDGFVRILQFRVFAHQRYFHLFLGVVQLLQKSVPRFQIRFLRRRVLENRQYFVVEPFFLHQDGHFIYTICVYALHHAVGAHVAEQRHLALHIVAQVLFGTADDNVGLYAQFLHGLYRVLGGLRLQFAGRRQEGHVGKVHDGGLVLHLPFQLAHRLYIRQRFDVAHGTANFGNHEVIVRLFGHEQDAPLDFVRNVRNHLHGAAQVFAAAFLFNDRLVDFTRRHVVGARGAHVREPFVVA